MSGVLIRVLVAIFAVVITFLLIPPVLRLIGLPELSGDFLLVIKIIVGALAVIYIWRGPTLPWRPAP